MSDPTCNRVVAVKHRLQQVVLAGVRGRPGATILSAGVDNDGRLVITLDDGTQVITDPINRPWGSIQGDITDRTDLMDLLGDKVDDDTFEQFMQDMTQALAEKLAIDVYNQFVLDVADALAGKVGDDDPRLSDSRTPTGGAGGVLSGQYPNPGFAVDMATQAELDAVAGAKVDKVAGKQLSTEDYTTAEKSKLAGIEAGAQVNAVTSVAGKTGVVTLVKGDVGLGNVDNTSDADKPVSTAQQEALDGKVDKVAGMGLSSNDFTDPLRDKLVGLEGTHWRGTFVSLAALEAGVTDPQAGDYADVDVAGEDVQRYIWDATDSAWVVQSGEVAPLTASQVKLLYESNPDTNAFTDADDAKLDGIEAGATANSTDAHLLNRANHTGTQAISTVAGLQGELDGKQPSAANLTALAGLSGAADHAPYFTEAGAMDLTPMGYGARLFLGNVTIGGSGGYTLERGTDTQSWPLTLSKASGLGTILRVDKATDAVSYFAIESGTNSSALLPLFRSFSNSTAAPSLYLVGDSPAGMDAGNSPMVMISGRIANGAVTNRPLLHIANRLNTRISVAADGSLRSVAPIRPGTYTVATLPPTADIGAEAYATNGRKAGEGVGEGTGVPVYYQGGWRTYYDNSIVVA